MLLEFVVEDLQSFAVVEQPSFQRFVKKLKPGYSLPVEKTLSTTMLAGAYGMVCGRIKEDLEKTVAVCLTTDALTSRNNNSYMAVTCRYVDVENETLKSATRPTTLQSS